SQGIGLLADGLGIRAVLGRLQIVQGRLDGRLGGVVDLVAVFGQSLLGRVDQAVGAVLGLDQFLAGLVRRGVGLGFLDHLLDVRVRQAAVGLNADRLFLVGRLVLGRHM